jgi:hypothetical protein
MGCVLIKLAVSSSRFDFTNSNYNYDNTNANVSFHHRIDGILKAMAIVGSAMVILISKVLRIK